MGVLPQRRLQQGASDLPPVCQNGRAGAPRSTARRRTAPARIAAPRVHGRSDSSLGARPGIAIVLAHVPTAPASPLPFVPLPCARLLPAAGARLAGALRRRGREVHALQRRGCAHGSAVPLRRAAPALAEARRAWRAAEPVFVPGILAARLPAHAGAIAATLAMFERLRRGGRWLDELDRRLPDDCGFVYAGSTVDRDDPREIERVFADAVRGGEVVARDLSALLAWIAHDDRDRSLRIRFSCGKDRVGDWLLADEATAEASSALAARAFPEGAAITGSRPLQRLLASLLQRPFRLGERIVYNNAPGGGAVFHHDAEPGQLGVAFSQLEGRTAWLAASKRRLGQILVAHGAARTLAAAMARLDGADGDAALQQVLNREPRFTAQLAARGALFVLRAGDCILLPSHGTDDVAWHSVFALGGRASLAHSYGIFPRRLAGGDDDG